MGDLSARNFGLLIAYLIPGFLALWGLSFGSDSVRGWLVGGSHAGPSVGSAMYVLIASVACGMTASVFRWAILDTIHHCTGVRRPVLDESKLSHHLEAFDYLVEAHYRYYQCYGNTLVALIFSYAAWRQSSPAAAVGMLELVLFVIAIMFLLGSRDALTKYYAGSALLLGIVPTTEPPHDQRQVSPQGNDTNPEKPTNPKSRDGS